VLRGDNLAGALTEVTMQSASVGWVDEEFALSFLECYRDTFRLQSPRDELRMARVDADGLGFRHIRFEQVWQGVPVLNAGIVVAIGGDLRIRSVTGSYLPSPTSLDTRPRLDAAGARRAAAGEMSGGVCSACTAELVVYPRPGVPPVLAWQVELRGGVTQRRRTIVDATSGHLLDSYDDVPTALPSVTVPGRKH
jgi:Zn-dependent metalloprotease